MFNRPKPSQKPQSASVHRLDTRDHSRSYVSNHRRMAQISLARLREAPLATLMTLLVLAIALTLPGVLYVGLTNIQAVSDQWQGSSQMTLYLGQQLSETQGQDLAAQLSANEQVDKAVYLSKAEALDEFKRYSGFADALEQLDVNPLPAAILLAPSEDYQTEERLRPLITQLSAIDGIDDVQLDLGWVQRLQAMAALAQRVVLVLAVLLGLAVVLVIGNTIRLEIENRRDEIVVVKLVGATDAFVQRPFLYTGFWYGLGAGLLAWGLIQLSLWYLGGAIYALVGLYAGDYAFSGLGVVATCVLVAASIFIGIAGAWLAVLRHLKSIEP